MDFLFGPDASLPVRFFIAFVIVLGLIGGTAYLVRRFGGERLAGAAGRGRQPRLAVVDGATVDGRRRLILIRRDNIEHLLLIGGPTDVVVEANIMRAAGTARDPAPPSRPTGAPEPTTRPASLEGNMWPLQPQVEPSAPAPSPAPAPRAPAPRPTVAEEPKWHAEPEPAPAPQPSPRPQPRPADPLAGLAAELARTTPAPDQSAAPRRMPRPSSREPSRAGNRDSSGDTNHEGVTESGHDTAPVNAGTEPSFAAPSDQNLAEMAQRLEAALRRPPKKPDEMRIAELTPRVPLTSLDPLPSSYQPAPAPVEPRPQRGEVRSLRPELPRTSPPRSEEPHPEESHSEPSRSETQRSEPPLRADPRPGPGQPRSLYDNLEQEMASLLGRPNRN